MTNGAQPYKVTMVRDTVSFANQPGGQQVKRVYVEFDDGHTTNLDVPADQYTAENVQAAIDEYYSRHQQVMQLGKGSTP